MSRTYTTLSREGYTYLIGLIRNLANVSEGIDDLHLLSNGTFSSVKIDTLLNTLRSDCNEYTDRLVANLSRLELKIANDESEISQPNIMYLYKASGETSYSQYVVIEGVKILLGTCDIDMGNYYTITQADAKFVLKTDFDSLKTEVEGKVDKTDIVTINDPSATDDQVYSAKAINTELDKVVKKADISTTIDSSSTDDTVPTNKAVYDNIKNKNTIQPSGTLANYSSVFDWAVNNVGASCGYEGNMFDDCPLNNTWGTLVCIGTKVESGLKVLFCTNFNKDIYIRTIQRRNGVNAWVTSWQRVCSTTVEDTSLKTLKNSSNINSDASITYMVKNGICTVSANTVSSTTMETGNITLTTGLPIPVNPSCWYSLSTNSNATTATLQNLLIRIDPSGNMIAYKGTNNVNYFGSFSYPVAES